MDSEEILKMAQGVAANLDLSKFKGDIVLIKQVENEVNNVEEGGIGIQKVYNSVPEQQTAPVQPHNEEPMFTDDTPELPSGSKDLHYELFGYAMKSIQGKLYAERPPENFIAHTYDWYAALRLGKDIDLLDGYDELKICMKGTGFFYPPKNAQNFTSYTKYINADSIFPKWKGPREKYLRKFHKIATEIYDVYVAECNKRGVKPYSPKQ